MESHWPAEETKHERIQVGSVLFGFLLGILIVFLYSHRFVVGTEISLSPLDLVNFVFTIGASSASIVLAIVAINLGTKSEERIIIHTKHSQELHQQLFQKTMEVLTRIESSSGVTEKRVEDVKRAVEATMGIRGLRTDVDIDEAVRKGLSSEPEESKKQWINKKRKETREKNKFQNKILSDIAGLFGVTTIKSADGDFFSAGNDLVDGVFEKNNKKFGVSVLFVPTTSNFTDYYGILMSHYIPALAKEIVANHFSRCFLITGRTEDQETLENLLSKEASVLAEGVKNNILVVQGSPEEIVKKISESVADFG